MATLLKLLFGLCAVLFALRAEAQLIPYEMVEQGPAPTAQTVFTAGRTMTDVGFNSFSNSLKILEGDDGIAFYVSAGAIPKLIFICNGVENGCNHDVDLADNFSFIVKDSSANEGFKITHDEIEVQDLKCRTTDPTTPASNRLKIYCKNDSFYKISDAGTVTELGAGGGATINTLGSFRPAQAEWPATNSAAFDTVNAHPIIKFADAVTQRVMFSDYLTQSYSGGDIIVVMRYAFSVGTTNSIRQCVAFEYMASAGQDIDGDGFATAKCVDITGNATQGVTFAGSITFTSAEIDGLIAGGLFRMYVERDGAHANDTAAGVAQLLGIQLRQ